MGECLQEAAPVVAVYLAQEEFHPTAEGHILLPGPRCRTRRESTGAHLLQENW